MMCCNLPAGGFRAERESATEGTLLIIFSVRCPCMSPLCYGAKPGFGTVDKWSGGALLSVYIAGRPRPCSWLWPNRWSWWRGPGAWTDSRCPPAVLAKLSRDPLLNSKKNTKKPTSAVFIELEGIHPGAWGQNRHLCLQIDELTCKACKSKPVFPYLKLI